MPERKCANADESRRAEPTGTPSVDAGANANRSAESQTGPGGEDGRAMLEFARRMDRIVFSWAQRERPKEEGQ